MLLQYLTAQPCHVGLGHLQSCLKDLVGVEGVANRDELHHVLPVQLNQQFAFSYVLQLLHIILVAKFKEGCGLIFEKVSLKLSSVDEPNEGSSTSSES